MDITEGTDAVLKVRLLQVGAAAGLFATLTLRLHDGTGERLPGLTREQSGGLGFELSVEFSRTAQMTRLEQGHMQMQVVLRVVGRFCDRTHGLPDLEAEIPERIEDGFDERLRGGGMPWNEHQ